MRQPAATLSIVGLAAVAGLGIAGGASEAPRDAASSRAGSLPAVEPAEVHMIEVEGEGADYWPRWRGPSGQGYVRGSGYLDRWSPTENVLWRVEVPGAGNSSPIVWEDHIFFLTAYEGGRRISLLSYRRGDGEKLWEVFVPQSGVEHAHDKNGHASATPVTDGDKVYASFGTHGLMAVDFDGDIVWHNDYGDLDNYHGSAGSPVLYDDKVIIYQDHQGDSFVAAFDKDSGAQVWWTARDDTRTGWGTPVVIRVDDHDELIVSSQRKVTAYDPSSGEELWFAAGNLFEVIPTPVVGHGLVFCSSGRAGPTLAIRPGGSGDVTDSHVVWTSSKGSPFVPSPIIVDDVLFMMNDMMSIVTAFEAPSGELLFQGRLGVARREGFSASPVVIDDKVYFTNDEGQVFVLRAGREFELLHVNDMGERTLASPAPVDGIWYWRTERHLLAIGD